MKNFKIIPMILIISVLFAAFAPCASAIEQPEIGAAAAVLVERNTGEVFFAKNETARVYPASTTKIMTVLLAIEACEAGTASPTDEVTASENMTYDLIADGSTANIQVGETMPLEDLMYCAMVASANEACNIIAEYIGGSIENFVARMNERAAELGCTGTHFANTHGLPDENHYTTAWDFYLISSAAMDYAMFEEICNTATYEVAETNMSPARTLQNTNGLINENSYYPGYYYEYAKGIKTGSTSAAGYCLISTASKNDIDLLAVVMGGVATEKEDGKLDYGSFSDSIALYEWAFENYSYQEILSSTETVTQVPVRHGADAETVSVRAETPITALLPNGTNMSEFDHDIVIYSQRDGEELEAPISAGEILGEITVTRDGVTYGTSNLVAGSSVELSKLDYMKTQIKDTLSKPLVKWVFWILVVLLAGYLALVIRYRILCIRRSRAVKQERRQRAAAEAENIQRRQFEKSRPPEVPKVEFFAPESEQPTEDKEARERDYFEEFFKK